VTKNQTLLAFGPVITADWLSATHFAICDSATYGAGNMLCYGSFTVAKTAQVGDTIQIAVDNLTITFA
jgi:hypothetical protein